MRHSDPKDRQPDSSRSMIDTCYHESLLLLRRNLTGAGILASTPNRRAETRNYDSIFGRDAAICALGMAASGEPDLVEAACAGLVTLARHQASNGQIPKFVKPANGEADFWYTGCIDATLWWLISIKYLDRLHPRLALETTFRLEISLALSWLNCQEHQTWRLLQQNEASDWADIMPRSGFVLYTNALWLKVKLLYDLPAAGSTRDFANLLFQPFGAAVPLERRARLFVHYIRNRSKNSRLYLSYVNLSAWGEEQDIFGNILASLTGVAAPSTAGSIAATLATMTAGDPFPIRVVGCPIEPQSTQWRLYMQRHRQNLPWQYHNGGIWPFVGGFWVLLLIKLGKKKAAVQELEKLAAANRAGEWEFNEWFHGQTGLPMGMAGQSWNAALFVLAFKTLNDRSRYLP